MKNVGRHNGEMQFSTIMAVTILLGSRSLFTNLTLCLCSGQIDPKNMLFFPKILVNVIALDSNLLTLFT